MMVTTKESLGQKIARLRGKTSQEAFEKLSGVPRRTIQNIEKGRTADPGIFTIKQIADALKVTVDFLLGYPEPSKDPLPEWAKHISSHLDKLEISKRDDLEIARLEKKIKTIPEEFFERWKDLHPALKAACLYFLTGEKSLISLLSDKTQAKLLGLFRVLRLENRKARS